MEETRAQGIRQRHAEAVTPAIYRYTEVVIARGEGSRVWDADGGSYVDFAAGIATMAVGHCHPRVVSAITEQASTLIHGASHVGYIEPYVTMAELLHSIAPSPLDRGKVILLNSGSEAVEAALKLARMVTGRIMVLAFSGSFHGRTQGALSLTSSSAAYRRGLGPVLGGVQHVPYPVVGSTGDAGGSPRWSDWIDIVFERLLPEEDLAAVIVEPILGEGGYHVPPDDFLPGLRDLCDRLGAILVADEVQTGLGRTGAWLASSHWGVVPDAVVLGKALGGGLPLGGVLAKRELMEAWQPAAHGSTFGGNPVACRAGVASLKIIQEEGLLERARTVGARIRERLERHSPSRVVNLRGKGLMIAFDVEDEDGRLLPAAAIGAVVRSAASFGVIVTKCGQSSIRIAPPLSISDSEADEGVDALISAISDATPAG